MSETLSTRQLVGDATPSLSVTFRTYAELAKPRLTTLLAVVTLATFHIAARATGQVFPASADMWLELIVLGTAVIVYSAGMFALNQYMERDVDRLMPRTAVRPLPSGRMRPQSALLFGIGFSIAGTAMLSVWINLLCGILAVVNLVIYLGLYTPLKMISPIHTTIGAFAGAMPPLVGWAAATGSVAPDAWFLAAIVFTWQFPHFYAVQLKNLRAYQRSGIRVLPVTNPSGERVRAEIVGWTVLTLVTSLLPLATGLVHPWYAVPAVVLWGVFGYDAIGTCRNYDARQARKLLKSSVLYLPLIFFVVGIALR